MTWPFEDSPKKNPQTPTRGIENADPWKSNICKASNIETRGLELHLFPTRSIATDGIDLLLLSRGITVALRFRSGRLRIGVALLCVIGLADDSIVLVQPENKLEFLLPPLPAAFLLVILSILRVPLGLSAPPRTPTARGGVGKPDVRIRTRVLAPLLLLLFFLLLLEAEAPLLEIQEGGSALLLPLLLYRLSHLGPRHPLSPRPPPPLSLSLNQARLFLVFLSVFSLWSGFSR